MKTDEINRIEHLARTFAVLAEYAAELELADTATKRSRAQKHAFAQLLKLCAEDEAIAIIRYVTEAHIRCRMCPNVHPQSRCTHGLCRECARQLQARTEVQ